MTNSEINRADELGREYWKLMDSFIDIHRKVTFIYGYLREATDGMSHRKNKMSLEQAKQYARQLDKAFPDGFEYPISYHEKQIEELNAEIAAELISDKDNGFKTRDFV